MPEMSAGMPDPLARLMEALVQLPGIGLRSAERIAFHLLRASREEAFTLAGAVRDLKEKLRHCQRCYNLTDEPMCAICRDARRDQGLIVVVEQPKDLMLLEQTGLIQGVYHVLMGHLSPIEGIEPSHLTIDALLERVRQGGVREIVLATNPNVEGDGTALHLQNVLRPFDVTVSRLARGLAVGSQVEFASRAMLEAAFTGRTPL